MEDGGGDEGETSVTLLLVPCLSLAAVCFFYCTRLLLLAIAGATRLRQQGEEMRRERGEGKKREEMISEREKKRRRERAKGRRGEEK